MLKGHSKKLKSPYLFMIWAIVYKIIKQEIHKRKERIYAYFIKTIT